MCVCVCCVSDSACHRACFCHGVSYEIVLCFKLNENLRTEAKKILRRLVVTVNERNKAYLIENSDTRQKNVDTKPSQAKPSNVGTKQSLAMLIPSQG